MSSSTFRVLYVEDEAMDAELLMMNVERYDFSAALNLDVTSTISEAERKIDTQEYDAAMIDWNLADGNGIDLAKYIRRSHTKLPILFLSGVFTPDRRQQAENFAPSACLEKDYSEDHVKSILRLLKDMS